MIELKVNGVEIVITNKPDLVPDIKEYIKTKGGTFISEERKKDNSGTMRTFINYSCKNGHLMSKRHDKIRIKWCGDCLLNVNKPDLIPEIKEFIEKKGGKFISSEVKKKNNDSTRTIITYLCEKGHENSKRHDMVEKTWCLECVNEPLYPYSVYKDIIEKKKGTIITKEEEHKNSETKFRFICSENHKCEMSGSSLRNDHWCIECNSSKNERLCRAIFEYLFKVKFNKSKHLRNPETKRFLELDGYNEELKIAFEYNGEQHYNSISYFGGDKKLIEQQKRDRHTESLCKEQGINLIVIPYTVKYKNIYSFIVDKFPEYNFEKNINYSLLDIKSNKEYKKSP